MFKKNIWLAILVTFVPILIVAVIGSIFVNLGTEWFDSLIKPSEWIPNWVIPVVWTIIYLVASVTIFFWVRSEDISKSLVVLFVINGVLNILWCLVFFTLNQLLLGLVVILLNFIFAIYLILETDKYRPIYARALLIYPVWISIATFLNVAVWILN